MKYFIKRGEFYNHYNLAYVNSDRDEELALAAGYERITRKEAERLASAERRRRKDDPSFAGYADAYIYPYGVDEDFENHPWYKDGFLVLKR